MPLGGDLPVDCFTAFRYSSVFIHGSTANFAYEVYRRKGRFYILRRALLYSATEKLTNCKHFIKIIVFISLKHIA